MQTAKLTRMQLDKQLNGIKNASGITRPLCGWIRVLRNALGMTSRQFARRAGITQARVSAMEKGETTNSLTLKTLEDAASVLNCRLVYFLIPEKSLEETVSEQAATFIRSNTCSVAYSMGLENQSVESKDTDDLIKILTEEILQKSPGKIWDVER